MKAIKTAPQLINQDSGSTEYYTPIPILDAASRTMGEYKTLGGTKYRFDLDPASSDRGNQHVNALWYYTEKMDGLKQDWVASTVWLNHPYGRDRNKAWINKAISEYKSGRASQICMIVWASTSEKWFQPLFEFPICFLNGRVRFIDPTRESTMSGATKSSAVIYMGKNVDKFIQEFCSLGNVMLPSVWRRRSASHSISDDMLIHEY